MKTLCEAIAQQRHRLIGLRLDMKKTYHMAKMVTLDGAVSPLCAKVPRAIDLSKASWTLRADAVTCPRCRAALKALEALDENSKPEPDMRHKRAMQESQEYAKALKALEGDDA